jgi:hypothetical protein
MQPAGPRGSAGELYRLLDACYDGPQLLDKQHAPAAPHDQQAADRLHCSLLYGEIFYPGVRALLDARHLAAGAAEALFDLGMGCGRALLQAFLEYPHLRKCVGVELARGRVAAAVDAMGALGCAQGWPLFLRLAGGPQAAAFLSRGPAGPPALPPPEAAAFLRARARAERLLSVHRTSLRAWVWWVWGRGRSLRRRLWGERRCGCGCSAAGVVGEGVGGESALSASLRVPVVCARWAELGDGDVAWLVDAAMGVAGHPAPEPECGCGTPDFADTDPAAFARIYREQAALEPPAQSCRVCASHHCYRAGAAGAHVHACPVQAPPAAAGLPGGELPGGEQAEAAEAERPSSSAPLRAAATSPAAPPPRVSTADPASLLLDHPAHAAGADGCRRHEGTYAPAARLAEAARARLRPDARIPHAAYVRAAAQLLRAGLVPAEAADARSAAQLECGLLLSPCAEHCWSTHKVAGGEVAAADDEDEGVADEGGADGRAAVATERTVAAERRAGGDPQPRGGAGGAPPAATLAAGGSAHVSPCWADVAALRARARAAGCWEGGHEGSLRGDAPEEAKEEAEAEAEAAAGRKEERCEEQTREAVARAVLGDAERYRRCTMLPPATRPAAASCADVTRAEYSLAATCERALDTPLFRLLLAAMRAVARGAATELADEPLANPATQPATEPATEPAAHGPGGAPCPWGSRPAVTAAASAGGLPELLNPRLRPPSAGHGPPPCSSHLATLPPPGGPCSNSSAAQTAPAPGLLPDAQPASPSSLFPAPGAEPGESLPASTLLSACYGERGRHTAAVVEAALGHAAPGPCTLCSGGSAPRAGCRGGAATLFSGASGAPKPLPAGGGAPDGSTELFARPAVADALPGAGSLLGSHAPPLLAAALSVPLSAEAMRHATPAPPRCWCPRHAHTLRADSPLDEAALQRFAEAPRGLALASGAGRPSLRRCAGPGLSGSPLVVRGALDAQDDTCPGRARLLQVRCGNLFSATDALQADVCVLEVKIRPPLYPRLRALLRSLKPGARVLTYEDVNDIFHGCACVSEREAEETRVRAALRDAYLLAGRRAVGLRAVAEDARVWCGGAGARWLHEHLLHERMMRRVGPAGGEDDGQRLRTRVAAAAAEAGSGLAFVCVRSPAASLAGASAASAAAVHEARVRVRRPARAPAAATSGSTSGSLPRRALATQPLPDDDEVADDEGGADEGDGDEWGGLPMGPREGGNRRLHTGLHTAAAAPPPPPAPALLADLLPRALAVATPSADLVMPAVASPPPPASAWKAFAAAPARIPPLGPAAGASAAAAEGARGAEEPARAQWLGADFEGPLPLPLHRGGRALLVEVLLAEVPAAAHEHAGAEAEAKGEGQAESPQSPRTRAGEDRRRPRWLLLSLPASAAAGLWGRSVWERGAALAGDTLGDALSSDAALLFNLLTAPCGCRAAAPHCPACPRLRLLVRALQQLLHLHAAPALAGYHLPVELAPAEGGEASGVDDEVHARQSARRAARGAAQWELALAGDAALARWRDSVDELAAALAATPAAGGLGGGAPDVRLSAARVLAASPLRPSPRQWLCTLPPSAVHTLRWVTAAAMSAADLVLELGEAGDVSLALRRGYSRGSADDAHALVSAPLPIPLPAPSLSRLTAAQAAAQLQQHGPGNCLLATMGNAALLPPACERGCTGTFALPAPLRRLDTNVQTDRVPTSWAVHVGHRFHQYMAL